MLATLQARLIVGGVVAALILFTVWRIHTNAFQAGYDQADQEYREMLAVQEAKARLDQEEDDAHSENVADEAETEIEEIEHRIRIIEREVPKYIERIVEVKPDCAVLPELGILFSQQAEAGNSQSNPD